MNTAKKNRNPFMYRKIIEKIEEVIVSTPANIGIFCASYKILGSLTDKFQGKDITSIIRKYGKQVFIEDPKKKSLLKMLRCLIILKKPLKEMVLYFWVFVVEGILRVKPILINLSIINFSYGRKKFNFY